MFQLQSTHLIQFQSTSSSAPVPVYFILGPAPCGSFSSLPACDAASPGMAHFHGLLFYKDSSSLGFLFSKTHFHSLLIHLNGCYFLLLLKYIVFLLCVYFNCIFKKLLVIILFIFNSKVNLVYYSRKPMIDYACIKHTFNFLHRTAAHPLPTNRPVS